MKDLNGVKKDCKKEENSGITILIVDDDDLVRKTIDQILIKHGYQTVTAKDGKSAISILSNKIVDIALLDYNLPDLNGIELIARFKEHCPSVLTIIITGYGTIERAVEAMQSGAWDFITKPITAGMLIEKIGRIQEFCYLRREHDFRKKVMNREFEFSGVIGPSSVMQTVYEQILRAAETSLPVLIEGETGSGKEYIAEAIHLNGKRKKHPFIIMDCTATPSSLIESTLFGSTKGAFTGAIERKGLLEAAHEGTLFLDEVGEIELEIQPKLLRCLETKRFRPVGSTKECFSDFRIICATNRDLQKETRLGHFRQDLYYRISAYRIVVPPLREHPSDIPSITQHFLNQVVEEQGQDNRVFTPSAMDVMKNYSWPGNIRQLKFVVENAYFSSNNEMIEEHHLQLESDPSRMPVIQDRDLIGQEELNKDFKTFREDVINQAEKNYLIKILEKTKGDVRLAAKQAGLTREAFYRVMSRCGLSPTDYRDH